MTGNAGSESKSPNGNIIRKKKRPYRGRNCGLRKRRWIEWSGSGDRCTVRDGTCSRAGIERDHTLGKGLWRSLRYDSWKGISAPPEPPGTSRMEKRVEKRSANHHDASIGHLRGTVKKKKGQIQRGLGKPIILRMTGRGGKIMEKTHLYFPR